MKFAYADPPYYGYASFYSDHPDHKKWDTLDAHKELVDQLLSNYPDGWAVSMTSGNLHDLLPLFPKSSRIASWIKPFASFKKNVNPAYTWEPVIFFGGRKKTLEENTVRDHLACNITLRKGLVGAKPEEFCRWIMALLGYQEGDILDDLFPGTGVMDRVKSEKRFA